MSFLENKFTSVFITFLKVEEEDEDEERRQPYQVYFISSHDNNTHSCPTYEFPLTDHKEDSSFKAMVKIGKEGKVEKIYSLRDALKIRFNELAKDFEKRSKEAEEGGNSYSPNPLAEGFAKGVWSSFDDAANDLKQLMREFDILELENQ